LNSPLLQEQKLALMDPTEDATAIPEKALVADEPLGTYADISITSDTKNYEDITARFIEAFGAKMLQASQESPENANHYYQTSWWAGGTSEDAEDPGWIKLSMEFILEIHPCGNVRFIENGNNYGGVVENYVPVGFIHKAQEIIASLMADNIFIEVEGRLYAKSIDSEKLVRAARENWFISEETEFKKSYYREVFYSSVSSKSQVFQYVVELSDTGWRFTRMDDQNSDLTAY